MLNANKFKLFEDKLRQATLLKRADSVYHPYYIFYTCKAYLIAQVPGDYLRDIVERFYLKEL